MNPINRDIFQKFCDLTASRRSYQKNSVVPVQRQEVFSGESIVALDAEFVSLAGDNVDLAMAVAASSAKPSLLSVGRVTVGKFVQTSQIFIAAFFFSIFIFSMTDKNFFSSAGEWFPDEHAADGRIRGGAW